MFDIGWTELLLVAVVAIVVVGPKELPDMLRNLGRGMRAVRRMASDFQGQFNDALKEAELDEVRDEFTRFRNSARNYTKLPDLHSIARDEIKGAIEGKPQPTPVDEQPPMLPSALPEPQLPVMQEPVIDVAPPAPVKKKRKPATPKVSADTDTPKAKTVFKAKAAPKKAAAKPAKQKVARKAGAAAVAPSEDAS